MSKDSSWSRGGPSIWLITTSTALTSMASSTQWMPPHPMALLLKDPSLLCKPAVQRCVWLLSIQPFPNWTLLLALFQAPILDLHFLWTVNLSFPPLLSRKSVRFWPKWQFNFPLQFFALGIQSSNQFARLCLGHTFCGFSRNIRP